MALNLSSRVAYLPMLSAVLTLVVAATPPTPEMVKAVFDHFYHGEEIILSEVVLCREVENADPERMHECNVNFGPSTTGRQRVFVHITALVPREHTKELTIQSRYEGTVRASKNVTLQGNRYSPRIRRYSGFSVGQPGRWTFVVSEGAKTLSETSLTVEPIPRRTR